MSDFDRGLLLTIVEHTPLVSIDLVVRNPAGQVLTGRRVNEPARGTWFVPGGRIHKNEDLDAAFERIAEDELGPGPWSRAASELMGAYTHIYSTNFAGVEGIGTHYVVLAHLINVEGIDALPTDQHSEYRWLARSDLDAPPEGGVHPHTAVYLEQLAGRR